MSNRKEHFCSNHTVDAVFAMAVVIALIGTGCVSNVGKGPITLTGQVEAAFAAYRAYDNPQEFWVSEDGRVSFFTYCDDTLCHYDVPAKRLCEELSGGVTCYVYARLGRVVWERDSKPLRPPVTSKRKSTSSGGYVDAVRFTSMILKKAEGQELADELSEVRLDHGLVYLYVKWRGLTLETHLAQFRVFDGVGNQVKVSSYEFTPKSTRWNTWFPYKIDPDVDQPGSWRFEVDLDGEMLVETSLVVTPSGYGSARSGTTKASRESAFRAYQNFDETPKYKCFVQNEDGAWAWRARETFYSAVEEATRACQRRSKGAGGQGECRVYAVGNNVVQGLSGKEQEDIINAYTE